MALTRLEKLRNRRTDPLINFSGVNEAYARLTDQDTAIQYAIGSMQPIDPDYRAQAMLDGPNLGVSVAPIEVELVNVSVEEMGFYLKREGWNDITSASLKDIYQRAQEFGLGLCTAEVGPQLRLQYLDQPKHDDDNVYIGMNPIPAPSSIKHNQSAIFRLASSEGKLVLTETSVMFHQQFYLRHRFIFLQNKR